MLFKNLKIKQFLNGILFNTLNIVLIYIYDKLTNNYYFKFRYNHN